MFRPADQAPAEEVMHHVSTVYALARVRLYSGKQLPGHRLSDVSSYNHLEEDPHSSAE
jgi:hypothetical protein